MAVFQISKIQIRRGQKQQGTGLPQLASGELAWAIDTQELYIGNGSVKEGAPAVGNTKILTSNDLSANGNLLGALQYVYKALDSSISTGSTTTSPVPRPIQARLDDAVSVKDFGAVNDGQLVDHLDPYSGYTGTDNTHALQRAIKQVFFNTTQKASDLDGSKRRVTLQIPAGVYVITDTVYIPSYTTLQGEGVNKTIIYFAPSNGNHNAAFQFINDSSVSVLTDTSSITPANIASTTSTNQPRDITIDGLTIITLTGSNPALQLDAVKNSVFKNLRIYGGWTSNNANSVGIKLSAFSSAVTCEDNNFQRVEIEKFTYGVSTYQDVLNNTFGNCHISNCYQGIVLGYNTTTNVQSSGVPGTNQQYGARQTLITECKFYNIKRHAVYVGLGYSNSTRNSRLMNVGANGSGNIGGPATYPQIFFAYAGNTSSEDISDRPADLATNTNAATYAPEVSGRVAYKLPSENAVTINYKLNPDLAFRLPVSMSAIGNPTGTIVYQISYTYNSSVFAFARSGTMTISADIDNGKIQLSDDYDFAGVDTNLTIAPVLDFSARFTDQNGAPYTGDVGQIPYTIQVRYVNPLSDGESIDNGTMYYTYTAIS